MPNINIELNEADVKKLIRQELQRQLGEIPLKDDAVKIETKSKQNYRSEWESAAFRVTYRDSFEV